MPKTRDLAIFVTTTTTTTDRQTKPIALPLAHARGVIMLDHVSFLFAGVIIG